MIADAGEGLATGPRKRHRSEKPIEHEGSHHPTPFTRTPSGPAPPCAPKCTKAATPEAPATWAKRFTSFLYYWGKRSAWKKRAPPLALN